MASTAFRLLQLFAFACLFFPCTNALAQSTKTNPEIQQNAYSQYEESNQLVAEAYAAAIGFLEGKTSEQAHQQKSILTTAQLSWMNYRGNHCQLLSGQQEHGKTGPNDAYYRCIAEINRHRHTELKALLARFRQDFPAGKNQ